MPITPVTPNELLVDERGFLSRDGVRRFQEIIEAINTLNTTAGMVAVLQGEGGASGVPIAHGHVHVAGSTATVVSGVNVGSVSVVSTGLLFVFFETAEADTLYTAVATGVNSTSAMMAGCDGRIAAGFYVRFRNNAGALANPTEFDFIAIRSR